MNEYEALIEASNRRYQWEFEVDTSVIYLTVKDVMGELGVTRATVLNWISKGDLKTIRRGNRGKHFIHPYHYEEFLSDYRRKKGQVPDVSGDHG